MKIAVIGGGIVGLNTSLELQREFRNANITIFASSFDKTVSHVAAGIFRISNSFSGPADAITRNWIRDSYEYYDAIRRSPEATLAGVTQLSGYIFAKHNPKLVENRWMEDLAPLYRNVDRDELELAGRNWDYGKFFTTLLTDCNIYLPWARAKLASGGARLIERTIDNINHITPEFDLVLNCTGMGARDLCGDRELVAIRGQVIKVKAPWIKTFAYGSIDTYVIPGLTGTCTLGGTRNFDSENEEVCRHDAAAIRERCTSLVPSLAKAETIRHMTGIRPHRGIVRVEIDPVLSRGKATVVHNYGHGGYGVCTAPGTAKYAVQQAMDSHRSSSKL